MTRPPKPRRRRVSQWLAVPAKLVVVRLFDAPTIWPLAAALALVGLLLAWPALGLVGISGRDILARLGAPPAPAPETTAALPAVAYTCAEQDIMRNNWAVFRDGLRSEAPRPWAVSPAGGKFLIPKEAVRRRANAAVEQLREGGALDEIGRELAAASAHLNDLDRSFIQYHRGLVDLRKGVFGDAVRQFAGVDKAISGDLGTLSAADSLRVEGVRAANQHAWGVALMPDHPAAGAAMLESALATAQQKDAHGLPRLAAPGQARVALFPISREAFVDLNLAEIYTDAIAANLRALAHARCDDKVYQLAVSRLEGDIKPFRDNVGATSEAQALAANLQVAGALLGDTDFVQKFPVLAGDSDAARASQAAHLVVGLDAVAPSDAGGADSKAVERWARLRTWRGDLYQGQSAKLFELLNAPPGDPGEAREDRRWLAELIRKGMAQPNVSRGDHARLARDYGPILGANPWSDPANRLPLVLGAIGLLLFVAIYLALVVAVVRVRNAYVRLFVSEHRRERLS